MLLAALVLVLAFSRKAPVVHSLEPRMARPGDTLTLKGEYFGANYQEAEVVLSGRIPTKGAIQSWSENQIVLTVPEEAVSGIVFVRNSQGKSEGLLFTNLNEMPTILTSPDAVGQPSLFSVEPAQPVPGQLVVLRGRALGDQVAGSEILLPLAVAAGEKPRTLILFPDQSESWSEQAIAFRLPAGVQSGALQVKVGDRTSNVLPLALDTSNGQRTVTGRRVVTVNLGAVLSFGQVFPGAQANLWWPVPRSDFAQQVLKVSPDGFTLVPSHDPGLAVQHLDSLPLNGKVTGKLQLQVELSASEPAVNTDRIEALDAENPGRLARWLKAEAGLPVQDSRLAAKADFIGGDDSNPYLKAWRIHSYLIDLLEPAEGTEKDPLKALESKKAKATDYAVLFVSFARLSGIPSRLVSGLLVPDTGNPQGHTWAEFFAAGLGWVPVDSAAADGAFQALLPLGNDPRRQFFGPTDLWHLALLRGNPSTRSLDSGGNQFDQFPAWAPLKGNLEVVGKADLTGLSWSAEAVAGGK